MTKSRQVYGFLRKFDIREDQGALNQIKDDLRMQPDLLDKTKQEDNNQDKNNQDKTSDKSDKKDDKSDDKGNNKDSAGDKNGDDESLTEDVTEKAKKLVGAAIDKAADLMESGSKMIKEARNGSDDSNKSDDKKS